MNPIHQVFAFYAGNKNYLDKYDLRAACNAVLGHLPSKQELDSACKFQTDCHVVLSQFQDFIKASQRRTTKRQRMRELFNAFDIRSKGFITEQDLRSVFLDVSGTSVANETISEIFSEADEDKDGRVTLEDFTRVMLNDN